MPDELRPEVGLGTMRYDTSEACVDSVATALELGYRHLDTAQKYENEAEVGRGIAESTVPREAITLATKISEENLAYDDVLRTAEESLERLGVDAVDILYVHWPAVTYDAEATLAAFDELVDAGKARHVGLGNFSPALIDEARDLLDAPVVAVQVEMHPLLRQDELVEYTRANDLYLVAYCPMMRGQLFDQPDLAEIAADAGLPVTQLSLAWLLTHDHVRPIPKATGEAHLRQNLEATSVDLDPDVVERIESIDRELRVVDPPKGPWNW